VAIHTSSDIIAQRYVVSSSVSHYTSSAASGSHIFGDSPDDTHQLTGSLRVSGSGNHWFKTGNIGVGITAPNHPIHINKSDSTAALVQFTNSTTGTEATDGAMIGIYATEEAWFSQRENNKLHLATQNTARLTVAGDGSYVEFPTANVKISGSSTSTGSFGTIYATEGSGPNVQVFNAGTRYQYMHQNMLVFENAGGVVRTLAGTDLVLQSNSTTGIQIAGSGQHVTFPVANQKISGSSTSTGSFGSALIGHNTGGTLQIGNIGSPSAGSSRLIIDKGGAGEAEIKFTRSRGANEDWKIYTNADESLLIEGVRSEEDLIIKTVPAGGSATERLRITSTGKISGSSTSTGSFGDLRVSRNGSFAVHGRGGDPFLGIGTASPAKRLHIQQGNSNALHEAVTIRTNSSGEGLMLGINADNSGYIYSTNAAAKGLRLSGISSARATGHLFISSSGDVGIGTTNLAGRLHVSGSGNEIFVVTGSAGNPEVGIGTNDPENILHINATGNAPVTIKSFGTDAFSGINLISSKGTAASPTDINEANYAIGKIRFMGRETSGDRPGAEIRATTEDVWTGTGHATRLEFHTGPGNVYSATEKMRIDKDGNVNIISGSISGSSSSTGSFGVLKLANYNQAYGSATSNTFFGGSTGAATTTGTNNTMVGYESAKVLTIGRYNTALGWRSLYSDVAGEESVAVGYGALFTQDMGDSRVSSKNTGVGLAVGYHNVTGTTNTWLGYEAGKGASGQSNTSNTGVGANALTAVTTGGSNVAIGKDAMVTATTAAENVAIGYEALGDIQAGSGANIAVGYYAMRNVDEGTGDGDADYNIAIGYDALKGGDFGSGNDGKDLQYNIAIGFQALDATAANSQTGTIAIGKDALGALTSGADCVAIGYHSMRQHTTGRSNTAIGSGTMGASGNDVTAQDNVFLGSYAGGGTWAGAGIDANIGIGYTALYGPMNGANNNIAIGYESGHDVVGGDANVMVGNHTGEKLTSASGSAFFGKNAGGALTTGNHNIAMGYYAMGSGTTTGDNNIAIGVTAGDALTSGKNNILLGKDAGGAMTTSQGNIAIGQNALDAATTGLDSNIAIGNNALGTTTGADQVVAIGNNAGGGGNMTSDADGTVAIGSYSGDAITSGRYNVAVGYESLSTDTQGDRSTAIGYRALVTQNGVNGEVHNTAVGYIAGDGITSGRWNTAIGSESGGGTTASGSVHIGKGAGGGISTGNNNIAIGLLAMDTTVTGDNNIAIGEIAGDAITSGYDNIFMGKDAGGANTEGRYNHFIGRDSGKLLTTGERNIAIGAFTLDAANGDEDFNIAIGHNALGTLDGNAADGNIGIGYAALDAATTANYNTAVGYATGDAVTTASGSVFMGRDAGGTVTTGNNNIAVGNDALNGATTTGDNNIAIGASALDAATTAYDNVAIGRDAMGTGTVTGFHNIAIGKSAGLSMAGGYNHVLLGATAGDALTGGRNNVAIGQHAFGTATTTEGCIAIGSATMESVNSTDANNTVGVGNEVLNALTDGQKNVAIGHQALNVVTTGNENTAVGYQALSAQQTDRNGATAVGSLALYQNAPAATTDYSAAFGQEAGSNQTTGYQNTFLGGQTSGNGADAINQIVIGYHAAGTGDNYAVIGNDAIQRVYAGDDTGAVLYAGSATVQTSDRRIKEKIESIDLGLDFINKLTPVQYEKRQPIDYDDSLKENLRWYKENESPRVLDDSEKSKQRVGFIAQDVGEVLEELGYDSNNDMVDVDEVTTQQHIAYSKLVAPMVKAIQELSEKNKALEKRIEKLENKLQ
tara:strand:- start:48 stop:5390 length:5343 start_codon:yes stop_codon:yes gene_type:complete